jgi:uncharacterized protein (TIGR02099 family)
MDQPSENPPVSALHISLKLATRLLEAAITLVFGCYLLLGAGLLTLRYAVLPNAQAFVPWMEQASTRALGLRVHIGAVQSQWTGLLPTLSLRDLVIDNPQGQPALRFASVEALPSWKSLPRLQLSFEQLAISGPQLTIVRTDAAHLDVGGIRFNLNAPGSGAAQRFADWLFEQDQILIQHGQITWVDAARGEAPLILRDVNLDLRNTQLQHRAALQATPPLDLGTPVDVRADFHQPLFLRHTADFSRWHGQLWASWPRVDLGQLARYTPLPAQVLGGRGSLQAWVDVGTQYTLSQATALVALHNAQARLAPSLPPLAFTDLSGRMTGKPLPGGFQISASALQFNTPQGAGLPALDATLSWQNPPGKGASGSLRTGPLDLQALDAVAAQLPLPATWHERLSQLQPQGRIDSLMATWQDPAGRAPTTLPAQYKLQIAFTGLGWNSPAAAITNAPRRGASTPSGAGSAAAAATEALAGDGAHLPRDLPGVQNLSGRIQADQSGGQAQLTMRRGAIALPTIFEAERLPVDSLATTLSWSHTPDGQWSVQAAKLQLSTPDASGTASLHYQTLARGPGLLNLTARLDRAEARAVPKYLPLGIPEGTRDYLRTAIAGGSSNDVRFVVQGPLADFPFKKPGSGVFSVTARIVDGAFNAAPVRILTKQEPAPPQDVHANATWPAFTDIAGLLECTGQGLQIRGASAHVFGASLRNVQISLPDFSKPVLSARGQVQAQASDALRYLRESPLDAKLGHALTQAQASGPLQVNLALVLPILDLKGSTVQGQVNLLGNQLDYLPILPPFDGVRGTVDFSDTGFSLRATAQNFLGGPLQVAGGQRTGKPLQLDASGTVSARALKAAPRLAPWRGLLRHLQGSTQFTARIGTTPAAEGTQPQVQLQSSLVGMAIDLPPPLGKAATATDTLRFDQSVSTPAAGPPQSVWRIDLGGDLRAQFVRHITPQGSTLQSGGIALGVQAEVPNPTQGVQANVRLPLLDLDAWQRALSVPTGAQAVQPGQAPPADMSGYLPQAISLRVGQLTVSDRLFDDVVLGATRAGSLWQANLDSKQVAGYVAWQMGQGEAPGSITARLSHLSLPKSADPDVERLLEHQPRSMPALNVVADDVDLHGHHFSRLDVRATNRDVGGMKEWRLNSFSLAAPEATVTGSGDWSATAPGALATGGAAPRRMAIGFRLVIQDAGELLARLGKPGLLKGGKGSMQGTVSWIGSPLSIDYPTLSGQLSVDLGKGQFLKADPGIAKLLGVLSLQSLPRRLLFNFSDLFESGFVFDKVGADVQLRDGVARTNNFKMSGVAATVFIDGSADLARETQDLYVVVVPEINAGSASLAYALVNPAVGLGTFIAQLIARKPLMKAFTYGYHVTGTWTKPDVRAAGDDRTTGSESPSATASRAEQARQTPAPSLAP